MKEKIYFPMTVNILTVGHIKCLDFLQKKGEVVIGLLTKKALQGYKKELVPFKERKFVLQRVFKGVKIISQNTLDPSENIIKSGCLAIASGDGWEKEELTAIHELGIKIINIRLRGEKRKRYSSTKIWKKKTI